MKNDKNGGVVIIFFNSTVRGRSSNICDDIITNIII